MHHPKKCYLRFAISFSLIFFLFSPNGFSQYISIHGVVKDASGIKPLQNAVAMAVKLSDSLLVKFTRTSAEGFFKLDSLPVDTYQVIVSHAAFGDQSIVVLGNQKDTFFDLKNVKLPPKSVTLTEVTIYGYADAVFYKGDTLVYTADSFKVQENAVVEDLLKKLPGIKVDSKGKIFSQGKAVDQVLVDGDEFFGSDPTMATKNLSAKSIESVQVYDKKNDNATENADKETLKVMNLQLKDNAKNGYFGKASGASDFNKYYETEALANKFTARQKISVFSLFSNTPRTALNWNDMYQYGLTNEYNSYNMDDGGMTTTWDDNKKEGIPTTAKTGFYYTDKLSKKTKLSFNYTFNKSTLKEQTSIISQYFLPDTAYGTAGLNKGDQAAYSHGLNLTLVQTFDSLTEMNFNSKMKNSYNNQSSFDDISFITSAGKISRSTQTTNTNDVINNSWINTVRITRTFRKKDRRLVGFYSSDIGDATSNGFLNSTNQYFLPAAIPDSVTNQKKTSTSSSNVQSGNLTYTEPLTKKVKIEFAYDFSASILNQDKKTMDYVNGNYDTENAILTNNFKSIRDIQRAGAKFIYDVKKQTVSIGTRLRQVFAENINVEDGEKVSQTVNNILPYMSYRYKFAENESSELRYTTYSDQPSLTQLQPVPDNTNPNYIVKGNPNLLPTYRHSFELNYYTYMITGKNIWSSVGYNFTNNAFSNATFYDSIGRTISQPINVQGNYSWYGYLGSTFPFHSRMYELSPSLNFNYNRNKNYINGIENITKEAAPNATLDFHIRKDSIEYGVGANYAYNYSSASLSTSSNRSYIVRSYNAFFNIALPLKMKFESNANYYINKYVTSGYNLNYFLWNASLSKTLLKNENLIIYLDGTDLLNQNISTRHNASDNVVSDTKTMVIGRYILLKAVFKFKSDKKKEEDEF